MKRIFSFLLILLILLITKVTLPPEEQLPSHAHFLLTLDSRGVSESQTADIPH